MKDFGTAAILCGGKSSRMGFDKCEVKVNGKLLIEIISEQLSKVFENVILISNDKNKFKNIRNEVVVDIIPNSGPLGGIYTALNHAESKYVFVTACDMPVINLDYIKYMMDLLKKQSFNGVASYNSGLIEPLYAFYSKEIIPVFEKELKNNNFKLFQVIKKCNMHYVKEEKARKYSKNMNIFTNLNYKSDLEFLESSFMEG
ncbi:molybdenum cofactor guanylyltransferase [Candidatus Clostridium stratigraminis]|uniref:Probable molybdenum cofactor guanylyltransferase n=1 Tax=Candidatus Clostridium stratigraminis TaxID=3381661 RepID=A0ABW8T279_9CLOT